jgi:hypothetical protein
MAVPESGERLAPELRGVGSVEHNCPAIGFVECSDDLKKGGFSGSACTNY